MQTTIQVEKSTAQALGGLKKKYNVSSYDKLLKIILEKGEKVPKSMLGKHPDLKPFKRKKDDFHDL